MFNEQRTVLNVLKVQKAQQAKFIVDVKEMSGERKFQKKRKTKKEFNRIWLEWQISY